MTLYLSFQSLYRKLSNLSNVFSDIDKLESNHLDLEAQAYLDDLYDDVSMTRRAISKNLFDIPDVDHLTNNELVILEKCFSEIPSAKMTWIFSLLLSKTAAAIPTNVHNRILLSVFNPVTQKIKHYDQTDPDIATGLAKHLAEAIDNPKCRIEQSELLDLLENDQTLDLEDVYLLYDYLNISRDQ